VSFAAILVLFFTDYTVITLVAYALMTACLANLVYVNAWKSFSVFTNGQPENPNKRHLERPLLNLDKQFLQDQVGLLVDEVNRKQANLRDLIYCENNINTIYAASLAYVVAWFAGLMPLGWTLLLGDVIAFIVPAQYIAHQAVVDHHLGIAHQKIDLLKRTFMDHLRKTMDKVPFLKAKVE